MGALANWIRGGSAATRVNTPVYNLGFHVARNMPATVVPAMQREVAPMPRHVSQATVIQETQKTKELQTQEKIIAEIVAQRAKQMESLAKIEQSYSTHGQNVMKTAQNLANTHSAYQQAFMLHGMKMGQEQAEVRGVEAALHGASQIVGDAWR